MILSFFWMFNKIFIIVHTSITCVHIKAKYNEKLLIDFAKCIRTTESVKNSNTYITKNANDYRRQSFVIILGKHIWLIHICRATCIYIVNVNTKKEEVPFFCNAVFLHNMILLFIIHTLLKSIDQVEKNTYLYESSDTTHAILYDRNIHILGFIYIS
jgi:hypothetical protein